MKKAILSLGIATTLLMTMNGVQTVDAKTTTAKSVQPYYKWSGYTGESYQFVTDKHFINAVKQSNVTINGWKVTTQLGKTNLKPVIKAYHDFKYKKKFDKKYLVKKHDTVAFKKDGKIIGIYLPVKKGKISIQTIEKAYLGQVVSRTQSDDSQLTGLGVPTKYGEISFSFDQKGKVTDIFLFASNSDKVDY